MNWIDYPEKRPEISGTYIISVTKPHNNGDSTFKYVAFYNADNNIWFKYDPFTEQIHEEINFRINGWIANFAIYIR